MNSIHSLRKHITLAERQADVAQTDGVRKAFLKVKFGYEMELAFLKAGIAASRFLNGKHTVFHQPTLNTVACGADPTVFPGCPFAARWLVAIKVMPPVGYVWQKAECVYTNVAACEQCRRKLEREPGKFIDEQWSLLGWFSFLDYTPEKKDAWLNFIPLEGVAGMQWVNNPGRVVLSNPVCVDTVVKES